MTPNPVAQSIVNDVKRLIRREEKRFAQGVIADLDEALDRSNDQLKTAYHWLITYRKLSAESKQI